MTKLVEVRFKFDRRAYYSNPNNISIYFNENVIVQADKGVDIGRVSAFNIDSNKINTKRLKIREIIRMATKKDASNLERIREKEKKANKVFIDLLEHYPFKMKLIESEFQFDGNKLTFYFMSETRIDFRKFVRELAKHFRTRIELRQINQRQQMKYLGGMGRCGRELCCKKMNLYTSKANIEMAKLQNVTTTTSKMTGLCRRTLCCLAFEQKFYRETADEFPLVGDWVKYKGEKAHVVKNYYLKSEVLIETENNVKVSIGLDKYLNLLTRKENPQKSTRKNLQDKVKSKKSSPIPKSKNKTSKNIQQTSKTSKNTMNKTKKREDRKKKPKKNKNQKSDHKSKNDSKLLKSTPSKQKKREKKSFRKLAKGKFHRKKKSKKHSKNRKSKRNSKKIKKQIKKEKATKSKKKKKFYRKHFSSKKRKTFSKKNKMNKNNSNRRERRN